MQSKTKTSHQVMLILLNLFLLPFLCRISIQIKVKHQVHKEKKAKEKKKIIGNFETCAY